MTYASMKVDNLNIKIFETRSEMGAHAAAEAAEYIRKLAKEKEEINILFAAAPSQNDIYGALIKEEGMPWEKINAMQLDEYIGINNDAPQRFANYLKEHIFKHVPIKNTFLIDCENPNVEEELQRYTKLLEDYPVDVAFIGIGENGHLAFNDPGVADFQDEVLMKIVELEEASRIQQVNDGCFEKVEDVPQKALTVTIPAILNAKRIFCVVPSSSKANAVYNTIYKNIDELYPSTILRRHDNVTLYLDKESASKIEINSL